MLNMFLCGQLTYLLQEFMHIAKYMNGQLVLKHMQYG